MRSAGSPPPHHPHPYNKTAPYDSRAHALPRGGAVRVLCGAPSRLCAVPPSDPVRCPLPLLCGAPFRFCAAPPDLNTSLPPAAAPPCSKARTCVQAAKGGASRQAGRQKRRGGAPVPPRRCSKGWKEGLGWHHASLSLRYWSRANLPPRQKLNPGCCNITSPLLSPPLYCRYVRQDAGRSPLFACFPSSPVLWRFRPPDEKPEPEGSARDGSNRHRET